MSVAWETEHLIGVWVGERSVRTGLDKLPRKSLLESGERWGNEVLLELFTEKVELWKLIVAIFFSSQSQSQSQEESRERERERERGRDLVLVLENEGEAGIGVGTRDFINWKWTLVAGAEANTATHIEGMLWSTSSIEIIF